METTYDPTVDAAYIRLGEGPSCETHTINDLVNVDLDEKGNLVGIEILAVSHQLDPGRLHQLDYRELGARPAAELEISAPPASRVAAKRSDGC